MPINILKGFEHLRMQLDALKSATNEFADGNKIGAGGFGEVYKGELVSSGHMVTVAVKRLNRIYGQGDSEFFKEIIMLSAYKHENIISLLGYCDEEDEKMLVYEYASKKSLDKHLDNNELTWAIRLKICIGAARGLAYLHDPAGGHTRLLHRDIKSSNILLDENWNAKIADFGLSKIGPANQQNSVIITNNNNVAGTIGYADPQYMETGMLTKESDVYSFGVVLFEVLCGRLCITDIGDRSKSLTNLVRYYHKRNRLNEIVWCNTKDEIQPSSLKSFSTIAYQCLKREYDTRPSMKTIMRNLETSLEYQKMALGSKHLKEDKKFGDKILLPEVQENASPGRRDIKSKWKVAYVALTAIFRLRSLRKKPDRKDAEEWMLDYALQSTLSKLTMTQKEKVSKLVEAYEVVSPLPKT